MISRRALALGLGLAILLAGGFRCYSAVRAWHLDRSLMQALSDNDVSAVENALAGGADANAKWPPYHDAYLPPPSGYESPVSVAVANDNAAIVTLLLRYGADPNTRAPGGQTVLWHSHSKAVARALKQAGAKE